MPLCTSTKPSASSAAMGDVHTCFHVARSTPPTVFELQPVPEAFGTVLMGDLRRQYPDGVSRHGAQHLAQPVGGVNATSAAETVIEAVRLGEFPSMRSRMTSWFAWESLDAARVFARGTGVRCEIWKVDGTVAHRGDMMLLNGHGAMPVAQSHHQARRYWRGEANEWQPATWELLVEPGARVVDRVDVVDPAGADRLDALERSIHEVLARQLELQMAVQGGLDG